MKRRRPVRKPFSEMSREEKIKEARAAIARLSHPHNRHSQNCKDAIRSWEKTLADLGVIES